MAATKDKVVKSFCTQCTNTTNHTVLHEAEQACTPANTPGMQIDFWGESHQIVACRGCEQRSFRVVTVCSEDFDPETGEPDETARSYPGEPPKPRNDMLPVRPFPHLTKKPRRIYRETMEAFNGELYTLAAGGLRAIVEAICSDKGVVDGPVEVKDNAGATKIVRGKNLQGKIAGMAEKGFLTSQQANVLHAHRFLGNDALHEIEMPDQSDLRTAIEIMEHTLVTIYELEHKGAELTRGRS